MSYLLAEFDTAHDLARAARAALEAGKPAQDALTPNPIQDLAHWLTPVKSSSPIGWVMFVAGVLGAIGGYFMQWFSAVIDYPILSGGRPPNSWPAFLIVPYETTILSAGVVGVLGWLWLCGLPKPYHPLFEGPVTLRATQDRYLLVFVPQRGLSDWIEQHLKPIAVHRCP